MSDLKFGWKCPCCSMVYAPHVNSCSCCVGYKVTGTAKIDTNGGIMERIERVTDRMYGPQAR